MYRVHVLKLVDVQPAERFALLPESKGKQVVKIRRARCSQQLAIQGDAFRLLPFSAFIRGNVVQQPPRRTGQPRRRDGLAREFQLQSAFRKRGLSFQHRIADRMEGSDRYFIRALHAGAQPTAHLFGGADGKSDRAYIFRLYAPFDEAGDPLGQRKRLARSRARDHGGHGCFALHRGFLHGVEPPAGRHLLFPFRFRGFFSAFSLFRCIRLRRNRNIRRDLVQKGKLPGRIFQLARRKEGDLPVFAVETRVPDDAPLAQPAYPLGDAAAAGDTDITEGDLAQYLRLGAQLPQHPDIDLPRLAPRCGDAERRADHLRQRHEVLEMLCVFGDKIFGTGSELFESVQDAYRDLFAAYGAFPAVFFRFLRGKPKPAVPMPVKVVFPFLRVEFQRAFKAIPRFQCPFQRGIGKLRGNKVALPAQLCGRVRVRIGDKRIAVEHGHAAVHRRIGGKPRFQRADMRREVAETLFDTIKPRKGAEQRKMRRPDMRGDEDCLGADVESDREQVFGGKPQDGPPVRADIADRFQPESEALRRIEGREQDDVVDFAHLSVLFIDAADLPRKDEARGNGKGERVAQARLFLYAVEPLLRRLEGIRKFLPPCGMREIARADQPDALAPRPQVEMRDIRVPARGAGIFGMNVQICQIHTLIIPPDPSFVNRKRQNSPRVQ